MNKIGSSNDKIKGTLVVIITVFIVGGLSLIFFLNSKDKVETISDTINQKVDEKPDSSLILINENAVTLMSLDGVMQRLSYSDFNEKFKNKNLPVEGSEASNGAVTYFSFPVSSGTRSLISPNRATVASRAAAQRDGAGVVVLKRGPQPEDKVVLRSSKGEPIRDVTILGWFNNQIVAATGSATSSKNLYAVKVDGKFNQILSLPDQIITAFVRGNYFWYATGSMGDGLENPPTGPSELHRVSVDGRDESIVSDQEMIFISVLPKQDSLIAYTKDNNESFFMKVGDEKSKISLGKRRPLVFIDHEFLVLRDGFDLVLFNIERGIASKIGSLPEGEVKVFLTTEKIDK